MGVLTNQAFKPPEKGKGAGDRPGLMTCAEDTKKTEEKDVKEECSDSWKKDEKEAKSVMEELDESSWKKESEKCDKVFEDYKACDDTTDCDAAKDAPDCLDFLKKKDKEVKKVKTVMDKYYYQCKDVTAD